MSESLKFAGKNDSNAVTPVSVSNEGHVRMNRKYKITQTELVNEVFTSSDTVYYPAYDARNSGVIALVVNNRSGVDLELQMYSILANGHGQNPVVSIIDSKGEMPKITIPAGKVMCITSEDWPMLLYAPYINLSLKPSGTPTGTSTTYIFIIDKG